MEKIWLQHYPKKVPSNIDVPEVNLCHLLEKAAEDNPQKTALIFLGKKLSYEEVNRQSNQFAISLKKDFGLNPGERIGLLLPNCPQFVISYFGALKAGATVVTCNPLYTIPELDYQLKDAGVKYLVSLDLKQLIEKVSGLEAVNQSGKYVERVIITNLKEYLPFPKNLLFPLVKRKELTKKSEIKRMKAESLMVDFQQMLSSGSTPKEVEAEVSSPEQTAVLIYTGGTTGTPKGACLTHRNLVANAIQIRNWFYKLSEGKEVFLAVLPLFHSFGMTTALNMAFYLKGTVVLLPKYDPTEVLEAIDRWKVTFFTGAPVMFKELIEHPKLSQYTLSSLKFCISGAAPLPKQVQNKFEEITGGKLIEGYGLTEASPATHCNPISPDAKQKGIGPPLPSTDCKIVDLESGKEEVAIGEEGELCVRGPQIMKEYWQKPEETEHVLRDGWLYTGDVAKMDSDGYFEITTRKKDIIIVQKTEYLTGLNVHPTEVEEVLLKHPDVEEAGVIGVPDPDQGEKVKAFVVAKEKAQIDPQQLIEFCSQRLAEYKVPSEIEFKDELPRNFLGKVLRRKLREANQPQQ